MDIRQLNPPIPMITPLGYALAYFVWPEDRLVWYGCFQQETGENWWWLNNYVRNVDYGDMWKWFSERYKTNSFTGHVIRWKLQALAEEA